MSPEALAAKDEDRDAEDVVGVRLLDAGLERGGAVAGEVGAVVGAGLAELGDQSGDLLGEVDLELAPEEARVDLLGVGAEEPVALGEQPADQRRGRIVDLERTLDRKAAAPGSPSGARPGTSTAPSTPSTELRSPLPLMRSRNGIQRSSTA